MRQLINIKEIKKLVIKFYDDRCMMYASALSFSSLLSIIPFLAIAFSILKALNVHELIAPQILSELSGGSHEVVERILRYIANTKVASLGIIGLLTLLITVMATLDNVEEAFNTVCDLQHGKAYHHKLRDYLIIIFSIPLLIALAVTISTTLQHQGVVKWLLHIPGAGALLLKLFKLLPSLSVGIALVCAFIFIPNTRISLKNAAIGAMLTGLVLHLVQLLYIYLQFGVSRYNAIYGALSLLPVFMIWIYTSWIIVLGGMEVVWYLQKLDLENSSAKTLIRVESD